MKRKLEDFESQVDASAWNTGGGASCFAASPCRGVGGVGNVDDAVNIDPTCAILQEEVKVNFAFLS